MTDTYRGIQIENAVGLYKKNGEYNKTVKNGLDILADMLEEKGHTLQGVYAGVFKKVLINFNCEHPPHLISPDSYKRGSGCPKCGDLRMAEKRFAHVKENFPLLVKEKGHKLLSEYKLSQQKVLIDFNCEHEPHWITPGHYKSGKGCPKCANETSSIRQSKQEREKFPSFVQSKGHTLLSNYGQNAHEKVLIDFHCEHEPSWIAPSKYKNGSGCPRCAGNSEQAEEDLLTLVASNGHILLSDYENKKTKVLIDFRCEHGPYWIMPDNYKQGAGCSRCGGRDHEFAKEKFSLLVASNGHRLLTPYGKNNLEKVLIDFGCEHVPHWISPSNYQRGKGCPHCTESKGEKIIREWLEAEGIPHVQQYIFPGQTKKYDFMLNLEDTVVEVHGPQHYEEEPFFKTRTLAEEQENDRLKKEYAEGRGYRYIVVDYRECVPKLALERFIQLYKELKSSEK